MTPFEVLAEAKRRSAEAVIAQSGIAHEGLRRHLRLLLSGDDPETTLLQEPVLEGTHPFVAATETMDELSGRLLHPDLIAALDDLTSDHDYRSRVIANLFCISFSRGACSPKVSRNRCWLLPAQARAKPNASCFPS